MCVHIVQHVQHAVHVVQHVVHMCMMLVCNMCNMHSMLCACCVCVWVVLQTCVVLLLQVVNMMCNIMQSNFNTITTSCTTSTATSVQNYTAQNLSNEYF